MIRPIQQSSYASLTVDSRADFRPFIPDIEAQIRRRIFDRGWNAFDAQMPRAKDRPFGRYRYRTGRLYASLKVIQPQRGQLVMIFNYEDVVLRFLESKYGRIFDWSPSDRRFIEELMPRALAAGGAAVTTSPQPVFGQPVVGLPRIPVAAPPAMVRVVDGLDWSVTRSGAIRIEPGLLKLPNGTVRTVPPTEFEPQPATQFGRYDAIVAEEGGLFYRIGKTSPYRPIGNAKPILFIFVPAAETDEPPVIYDAK